MTGTNDRKNGTLHSSSKVHSVVERKFPWTGDYIHHLPLCFAGKLRTGKRGTVSSCSLTEKPVDCQRCLSKIRMIEEKRRKRTGLSGPISQARIQSEVSNSQEMTEAGYSWDGTNWVRLPGKGVSPLSEVTKVIEAQEKKSLEPRTAKEGRWVKGQEEITKALEKNWGKDGVSETGEILPRVLCSFCSQTKIEGKERFCEGCKKTYPALENSGVEFSSKNFVAAKLNEILLELQRDRRILSSKIRFSPGRASTPEYERVVEIQRMVERLFLAL